MNDVSVSPPQPIHGERALLISGEDHEKIVVISDVHVGFEEELQRDGMYIPDQTMEMLKRLKKIISQKKIKRIIINGDLKHRVPRTSWKKRKKKLDSVMEDEKQKGVELEEEITALVKKMKKADASERKKLQKKFEGLEEKQSRFYRKKRKKKNRIIERSETELRKVMLFLKGLLEFCELDVIPGNHDGRIEKELKNSFPTLASDPGLRFHTSKGITIGKNGIFHGHAWPSEEVMSKPFLITGHGHSAILLSDELGVRSYEPCWLKADLTEKVHQRYVAASGQIILMPSFNDFFQGSPVNKKGRLLGPIFKNDYVDVRNGEVFLVDGINLGKVAALEKFADANRGRRRKRL